MSLFLFFLYCGVFFRMNMYVSRILNTTTKNGLCNKSTREQTLFNNFFLVLFSYFIWFFSVMIYWHGHVCCWSIRYISLTWRTTPPTKLSVFAKLQLRWLNNLDTKHARPRVLSSHRNAWIGLVVYGTCPRLIYNIWSSHMPNVICVVGMLCTIHARMRVVLNLNNV